MKPELGSYFDSGRRRRGFRIRPAELLSGIDFIQIGALLFLIGTGLLFIYSTGAQVGGDHAASFFFRQLRWIGAGGVLWLFCSLIDYRKIQYRILAVLFYLVTIVLLVLVFFIGVKVYGATRWLSIAPLGMRLQPSEFCKLALVMVLSAMFASPMFKVNRLPCLLLGAGTVALPFVLIVREPDLGSALILLPIYLAILFTAGLKWRYILLAGVAISILGGVVVLNEAGPHRHRVQLLPGASGGRFRRTDREGDRRGDAEYARISAADRFQQRLHLFGDRRGGRISRLPAAARGLPGAFLFDHPHRVSHRGSLRTLSGGRNRRHLLHPLLHQHRHEHRAGAGDRTFAPLRQLWRLLHADGAGGLRPAPVGLPLPEFALTAR